MKYKLNNFFEEKKNTNNALFLCNTWQPIVQVVTVVCNEVVDDVVYPFLPFSIGFFQFIKIFYQKFLNASTLKLVVMIYERMAGRNEAGEGC